MEIEGLVSTKKLKQIHDLLWAQCLLFAQRVLVEVECWDCGERMEEKGGEMMLVADLR